MLERNLLFPRSFSVARKSRAKTHYVITQHGALGDILHKPYAVELQNRMQYRLHIY
jgi:hypothetical protein